jgi:hypothetical protein
MAKTESEALFETYLALIGVGFDHEPDFGGKRPDYWLKDTGGAYQAVVEVKELEWPSAIPRATPETGPQAYGVDSYTPLREKINVAAKQFRAAKHLPCLLVLYNKGCFYHLDDRLVYGAMLGDITIQVPIAVNRRRRQARDDEARVVFGKGGKMIDPVNKRPWNTTISAIAILETINIEQHRSGYLAELNTRCDAVPAGETLVDIWHALSPVFDELDDKYRKRGVDLQRKEPRLRIYRNPYARIAWPQSLTSDSDEIWGPDSDGKHIVRVFDGLASTTDG